MERELVLFNNVLASVLLAAEHTNKASILTLLKRRKREINVPAQRKHFYSQVHTISFNSDLNLHQVLINHGWRAFIKKVLRNDA